MPDGEAKYRHELPELPYALDALEPFISRETLEFHYGKHHRAYVDKLNALIAGTPLEGMSLRELIRTQTGSLFNNAAQVWNHGFYWKCLTPEEDTRPDAKLQAALEKNFESLEKFREQFNAAALAKFGSGWTWLIYRADGTLAIQNTDDADTPLRTGETPLLVCDVWEHAYYIDYRNDRGTYLNNFWKIANWRFAGNNFAAGLIS